MNRFLLISIGAILGANARYLIGLWASAHIGEDFPYGTAIVNITGSLLLGFLMAWGAARGGVSPEVHLMVAVGFFGSFTTFSTFATDTIHEAENVNLARGFLNIFVNNGFGILAAWLGIALATRFTTP
jgi:fluoride exporter